MAIFPHTGINTDIAPAYTQIKFISYDPIVSNQTITSNVTFQAKHFFTELANTNRTD